MVLSLSVCNKHFTSIYIGVRARRVAAPDSGKDIIFRAKAKFFGQKPKAKNEKNCIY